MSTESLMKAYVIFEPGGPEKIEMMEIPRPVPCAGQVLIKVHAFGLNRSEWFTRRGDSPSVKFPRVLGIECAGEVIAAPGDRLQAGQCVVAMMGGMGREFDGSYAEYVLVPRAQTFPVQTGLGWTMLGALPEMLQTAHGSLHTGLEINRAKNLIVRGATSSVGMAAIALADFANIEVTATTRNPSKTKALVAAGAKHVIIDDGMISAKARSIYPDGFDRVLELVGASTLLDSLRSVRRGGIVCMTGMLGGEWILPEFHPMGGVPTGVKLTSYSGDASDISVEQFQHYVSLVESGKLGLKVGPVFPFTRLQQAHAIMDENQANGKIVIDVTSMTRGM